jgi:hypothetical protein
MERKNIAGHDWVSCNAREFGGAGHWVHLISQARRRTHWQTTACGATASMPGIWRIPPKNTPKPTCVACARVAERLSS